MSAERVGVLGAFHLGAALKPMAKKLGERRGRSAVAMLSSRLEQSIGAAKGDGYSYIWRSAIEDHDQDSHEESYRSVLVDALRDATLGATERASEDADACVEALLKSDAPILVRIGIYVCGENYGSVGHVFWKCLQPAWFIEVDYWHEIFWFIKKAFTKFTAPQRQQFLDIVDRTKGEWSDASRSEEWDQEHRRDLLYPAVGLGDETVDTKFKALEELRGPVREHPDFHSYSTGGWMGERSPVVPDALVAKSAEELRELFESFVPEPRAWDGPTYRGLAATLSAAVRASDDGFANRFEVFESQARPYQHGLLRGLKERWVDDKRDIAWARVVSLVESIVRAASFGQDLHAERAEGWEPSVHWVVSDIAGLLKAGAQRERSMPLELYPQSLAVLRLILEAIRPEGRADTDDAVSHAINSPRGHAIEAFIHVALAMRRHEAEDSGGKVTWAQVGPVLETELASSESGDNSDFSALAGMYCVNFHYLNSEWTEASIDRIFSLANPSAWKCAVQGFSYQTHLYDWLYQRLAAGGHFKQMLVAPGLPGQVSKRATEFIGLAYLKGQEALEGDGLLAWLIASLDEKGISHLSWFFWTLRPKEGSPASPHRLKVLAFWLQIAEQIRKSGQESPTLQSSLNLLAVFIEDLNDPIADAWELTAPYAQRQHHGYVLVQELARLAERYPKEVSRIFQAALNGFLPDYRREDIVSCVQRLAAAGCGEDAEKICNLYAERQSDLLKEAYVAIRAQQKAGAPGADA